MSVSLPFGDDLVVYVRGEYVALRDASISILDRGFLYGDGIYETMLATGGNVFRLDDHLDRLFASAHTLRLALPLSQDGLAEVVSEVLTRNQLEDAYVRVVVSRGVGFPILDARTPTGDSTVIVMAHTREQPAEVAGSYHQEGLDLKVVSIRKTPPECLLPQVKSLNYLNQLLARMEATDAGADEAVMLDTHGMVAEGSGDNIFAVKGTQLVTPEPLTILPGITRRTVIDVAPAVGLTVSERQVTPYDLYNADEVFLTSTYGGVLPVKSIDGRQNRILGSGAQDSGDPHLLLGASWRHERSRPPLMQHAESESAWTDRLARDHRRVFVLDDDPTGTQTTSATDILFDASASEIARFLESRARGIHILTNTRALAPSKAIARVEATVDLIRSACRNADRPSPALMLRGDSTLRGHTFDEIDALGGSESVALFVPALPQAGRVTIGGIQWLLKADAAIPVRETEYATDPVFGYRSESLTEWVDEVGGRTGRIVPLTALRSSGSSAVSGALAQLDSREVLIPDAASVDDLRLIAAGLLDAESAGVNVVVRSAAAFASVRYGAPERDASRDLVSLLPRDPGVLVICGSHMASSTGQLAALSSHTGAEVRLLPTDVALGSHAGLRSYRDIGHRRPSEHSIGDLGDRTQPSRRALESRCRRTSDEVADVCGPARR